MSIQMVCVRDYVLRTRLGHTIMFKAGEPTGVPEAAYGEALARNILPFERPDDERPAYEQAKAQITGPLRDALIFETILELVKRNDVADFGGGMVKAASLSRETGLSISTSEASSYHSQYKEIVGSNGEFPKHPNVALVRELQGLSTRKQLEEFAESQGMAMPELRGKTTKDIKQALLYNIISVRQVPEAGEYVKPDSLTMD